MSRRRGARWFGELVVIVLGVLAALAVDDWRDFRSDRGIEQQLLDRLQIALVADSADLATAQRLVTERLWVVEALLADQAQSEPPPIPAVVRRGPAALPLRTFRGWPDFDVSDDVYQEMLATGSLERAGQFILRFEEALSWVDVSVGLRDHPHERLALSQS